ncbi:MAG TPA: hypothetical protein VK455_00990 [Thermoplasmata archaeon]|nr:hypothetical protein [Thermoplasmata archaeon]
MPAGGSFSRSIPGPVVAVVIVALVLSWGPPPHSSSSPPTAFATSGACAGSHLRPVYAGTLKVDGGPLPPNGTGGATIRFSYFVDVWVVDEPGGVVASASCASLSGSVTTDAGGAFSFAPTTPRSYCTPVPNGTVCTDYSSAIGPLTPSLSEPPPDGYALSFDVTSDAADLALVWLLEDITLSPAGSTLTVAPGAPISLVASGWQGNGSATPLDPAYTWTLNGTGWALSTAPVGDRATIVSVPGATAGKLTVQAEATVNGTALSPPPRTIALDAVATTLAEAELNRTELDVGSNVSANVTVVGAAGYAYRAWLDPGLGLAAVQVPCGTTAYGPGTVLATCLANLTYTGPGIAQPAFNVTNGFSAAIGQFPSVMVDPAAALWVTPGFPTGYALSPLPVELIATAGSGILPFEEACLDPGSGAPLCTSAPGPSWTFDPVYASPGQYTASAWAVDSEGTNRSVSFVVTVVAPLAATSLDLETPNATVGANLSVSSTITGGDLPGRYWWNASTEDAPLESGELGADGQLWLSFVPSGTGSVTLTLTARDALGTVVRSALALTVGPASAVRLTETGTPPASSVVVGGSVPLSWEALDGSDQPVPTFSTNASVVLAGPGSTAPVGWVNASTVGPLTGGGNGTFEVPGAAWVNGTLALTVEVLAAGPFSVELVGRGLPSAVPEIHILANPDTEHLRLYDPVVAVSGTRTNATYWQVEDRFANAVPGANVTIRYVWGSESSEENETASPESNGSTGVWVNFSAPGPEGGTVTVLDGAGKALLGPLTVPALAAADDLAVPYGVVGALLGIVALGAGVMLVALRRARRRAPGPSDESELQRLAEGRAAIVEIVRRHGPVDLPEVESSWQPPPAPPDLADWLASLVTDGTLGASVGPDGKARFCLAPGPSAPRVTLDTEAFDEALRLRDEELAGDGPGP